MKKSEIILIYHPGALGDVILTFPALRAIRKLLPDRKLAGLGNASSYRLAQELGLVDEVLDQEDGRLSRFFALHEMPPDLNHLYAAFLWLKDPHHMHYFLQKHTLGPVIDLSPVPQENQHMSLSYLQTIRKYLPIHIPGDIHELLPEPPCDGEYILIHPGSGSPKKIFPPEFYRQLESLLEHHRPEKICYLLGPAELENGLAARLSNKHILTPPSPTDLYRLFQKTSLYIGNDSGPSQLAGYLQIPSIVFYISTDPNIWGTLGKQSVHITGNNPDESHRKFANLLDSFPTPGR
jgi:ADP-heptose:LPS heptosyltransferase